MDEIGKFIKINVLPESKLLLHKLRQKSKVSAYEYFHAAMKFLDVNGIDPYDIEVSKPSIEVKKLHKTFVSFTRQQEKDYLLPIRDQLDEIVKLIARSDRVAEGISKEKEIKKPVTGGKFYMPDSDRESQAKDENIKVGKLQNEVDEYKRRLNFIKGKFTDKKDGFACSLTISEFNDLFDVR